MFSHKAVAERSRHSFLIPLLATLALACGDVPELGEEPLEGELAGGERHGYELRLEEGEFFHVRLDQNGVDLVLELHGPNGAEPLEIDSPTGEDGLEELFAIAETKGRHRVEVWPADDDAERGSYVLELVARRAPAPEDLRRIEADRLHREAHRLRVGEDFEKSRSRYGEAIALWETLDRPGDQAESLWGLAQALKALEETETALEALEKALKLSQDARDRALEAKVHQSIGRFAVELEDRPKALEHLEKAVELFEDTSRDRGLAGTLGVLGAIYEALGRIEDADIAYRRALGFQRVHPRTRAGILLNAGKTALDLSQPREALARFSEAFELSQELGLDGYVWLALQGLAESARRLDEFERSEELLEKALARIEPGDLVPRALILESLGRLRHEQGDSESAAELFEEALGLARDIDKTRLIRTLLINLGHVTTLLGDPERGLELLGEALELARETKNVADEASSRVRGAQALAALGRPLDAWRRLEPGLDLVESLRDQSQEQNARLRYFEFRQEYYEIAWGLLMRLGAENPDAGYEELAFAVNERRLARDLLDTVGEKRSIEASNVDPALLEAENDLEQKIRELTRLGGTAERDEETLANLLGELDRVRGQIRKSAPRHAALEPTRPVGVREARELIGPDSLLLVYALGEETSYLWALDQERLSTHSLPARAELERLARRWTDAISERGGRARARRLADGPRLSDALLGPIAERLENQRLLVVTEGALQRLPFTALSKPGVEGEHPLILDHEIVALPSISIVEALRRHRDEGSTAPSSVAIFADPVFRADDPRLGGRGSPSRPGALERTVEALGLGGLERLPGTRREAEAIAELTDGEIFLASGFEAHRGAVERLEAEPRDVIHFATHGLVNPRHPELSGLVLSLFDRSGQPEDGYLRAFEISSLDLRAELVVLSACQTGLGLDIRGEGMLGLSRSFLHAGARRVVMSLWRVDDRATAELMRTFYRAHLREGLSPIAALRNAQLEILRHPETSEPYFWAAFTFQGEWR